ncbi:MAG: Ig-like domain repeat protein, partial [Acidobacteria bacterium]|nr:Ig-like domain repeat protein [Acidobacteriota bacterium]
TATDRTKTYGETVAFAGSEFTTVGLLNTDTVSSVTLTSAGAPGTASVGGSPYSIVPSAAVGAGLGNYSITYVNGQLTVDPKPASVTPDPKTKIYGDVDPALTGTLDGFLETDGVTATYSRTPGEGVAGSPYVISASLNPADVLSNYAITSNTAVFTITPAETTTSLASSPNPATGPEDITFTATITVVAPGGGVPSGVVEFYDGGTLLEIGPVAVVDGSFVATFTTTLAGGEHSISARYAGTDDHQGSTSAVLTQTVFGPPSQPGPPADPGPPTDPGPPNNVPGGGPPASPPGGGGRP